MSKKKSTEQFYNQIGLPTLCMFRYCSVDHDFIIIEVVSALGLVENNDLLENRCTDDVITVTEDLSASQSQ
jgi:hypothetical protein